MNILTRKLQKSLFATLLLLLCSFSSWAQGLSVEGKVVDSQGEPIIGVSVTLQSDSSIGEMTDIDGNYQIVVPSANAVLEYSYVGMVTQAKAVTSRTVINVTLIEDSQIMDEVVVVGYGQQKKASVVGAITQTSGQVLERTGGVSNLGSALTGNLPGVVTTQSTGMPGEEDPQIVIRGASSWNNSSPLILVDGIEREMSSVDISSVESISVLKDASATAVYGVKGANGVILVTTKRGKEGEAKINVGGNYTFKVPSKLPNKMDSYDALTARNVAIENELSLSPTSWNDITPQAIIEKYRYPANLEESERYPNVDWQDAMFKDFATSYNANLNISGGSNTVRYYVAADYSHEGDLFEKWDNGRGYNTEFTYDRLNVRSNLDFQLTPTTKFSANLAGTTGIQTTPWGYTGSSDYAITQLWAGAYNIAPDVFLPQYSDGTWGFYPNISNVTNSVEELAHRGSMETTKTMINTDFTLVQDLSMITKGLSARGMVSWDNTIQEYQRGISDQYNYPQTKWIDPKTGIASPEFAYDNNTFFDYTPEMVWKENSGSIQNWKTVRKLNYQGQINWARNYGKHAVTAMGLFSRQELAIGSQVPNYREDWAFRTTYDYDNRYFIEYNGAYNGSEKFAPEYRFAFFNSGAIGWMISEEKFMKSVKFLDMLKLRASYGEIGDDNVKTRWLYMSQWSYGGQSKMDSYAKNSPYTWYTESSVGNEDVHWETVAKTNIGLDYSLFGGLLAGNVEVFQDNRRDILIDGKTRAVPSYYGTTAPTANLGKVQTNGYEVEVRLNKVFANKMRVWGNFNITHAKNMIIERDDPQLLPDYQKAAGYTMNQHKGYIDAGFCNTYDQVYGSTQFDTNDSQKLTGSYRIIDYNSDGVINNEDEVPFGYATTPQNTYNAVIGWEWKGFSVFAQFYGVTNTNRSVNLVSFNNKLNTVYDQGTWWSKGNPDAEVTAPRWGSTPTNDYNYGTQFLYDGSYVRLKNLEISYKFDNALTRQFGVSNLKLFVNGNNLWVWTRMPDDRESNYSTGGNTGAYPTMKRYNFGVKFSL